METLTGNTPLKTTFFVAVLAISCTAVADANKKAPGAAERTKFVATECETESATANQNAGQRGKLEAALLLNEHLNRFKIDTRIAGKTAFLSGVVATDIDQNLARQIALSIEGIESVESDLTVDKLEAASSSALPSATDNELPWAQRLDDMTISAIVKTKLIENDNTSGANIDVVTEESIVTLSGQVESSGERILAEYIAQNTDGVASVISNLSVSQSISQRY